MALLVTWVGPSDPVVLRDLGGRSLGSGTVDLDLSLEFSHNELSESLDLQAALDSGELSAVDANGAQVTDVSAAASADFQGSASLGAPFGSYVVAENSGNPDLIYYGLAFSETALTAAAVWRIYRADVSAEPVTFTYADGDLAADNVWDNRESLTYSGLQ